MFAYCGNNPVTRVDTSGRFWEELWTVFTQTIQQASGYFATALGVTQMDSPALGPADLLGAAMAIGGILACTGVAVGTLVFAEPPTSILDEEEILTYAQITEEPEDVIIYRYYSSRTNNLAPREGIDYDGLSFSTKPPRPGVKAVMTTIDTVNSTGVLFAYQTSASHVLIVPRVGTVGMWMLQGHDSIWTRVLANIVLEMGG